MFAEHEKSCAKQGGCKALAQAGVFDFNVTKYLQELRRTLPYVPPISEGALKSLHNAGDHKGMVRLIKKAMNIEDVTFVVHWVPDGAAKKGAHKNAPAWVELPSEMPIYGSNAFKEMKIKMYFRKSFFEQAYDEAAVAVAHEFSHVVLESIRHPLRKCEKVVDLTAMLLGFRRLNESACYKERRSGNKIEIKTLGYLSREEVQRASQSLAQEQRQSKAKALPSLRAFIARKKIAIACAALVATVTLVGAKPAYRVWQLHQRLLAEQIEVQKQIPEWQNAITVLIRVRVGITSLSRTYQVTLSSDEEADWPSSFERDIRRWACVQEPATIQDGATYNFEYRDSQDRFLRQVQIASCP